MAWYYWVLIITGGTVMIAVCCPGLTGDVLSAIFDAVIDTFTSGES